MDSSSTEWVVLHPWETYWDQVMTLYPIGDEPKALTALLIYWQEGKMRKHEENGISSPWKCGKLRSEYFCSNPVSPKVNREEMVRNKVKAANIYWKRDFRLF